EGPRRESLQVRDAHSNSESRGARRSRYRGKEAGMISRRDLLKTAAVAVSFRFRLNAQTSTQTPGKPVDPKQVDSFLPLLPDGSVTVYTGKVDLGTGLRIAIRQMAAEELDVPIEKVTLVEGDTALTPDQGSTGGSTGLTRGGVEVRQAAATARQALLASPRNS